ncbi:MAG: hypothetical protein KatS3mg096_532 [Candidatus Parcubacteria bacterium]|nr:MAG: hypothetical protein KatS3mg096_532 [Candidatus Parcubacteria bacterium]
MGKEALTKINWIIFSLFWVINETFVNILKKVDVYNIDFYLGCCGNINYCVIFKSNFYKSDSNFYIYKIKSKF